MSFSSELAAAEYYIRSTCKGSVALAAFTSTVEPQPLPRGAQTPAVVYTLLHSSYVTTVEGVRVYTRLLYRISAFGQFQTIMTLSQMDSIIQDLFGGGRNAQVNAETPYGTIMAVTITRPHSFPYKDPADETLMRYVGASYMFEVKGL